MKIGLEIENIFKTCGLSEGEACRSDRQKVLALAGNLLADKYQKEPGLLVEFHQKLGLALAVNIGDNYNYLILSFNALGRLTEMGLVPQAQVGDYLVRLWQKAASGEISRRTALDVCHVLLPKYYPLISTLDLAVKQLSSKRNYASLPKREIDLAADFISALSSVKAQPVEDKSTPYNNMEIINPRKAGVFLDKFEGLKQRLSRGVKIQDIEPPDAQMSVAVEGVKTSSAPTVNPGYQKVLEKLNAEKKPKGYSI